MTGRAGAALIPAMMAKLAYEERKLSAAILRERIAACMQDSKTFKSDELRSGVVGIKAPYATGSLAAYSKVLDIIEDLLSAEIALEEHRTGGD